MLNNARHADTVDWAALEAQGVCTGCENFKKDLLLSSHTPTVETLRRSPLLFLKFSSASNKYECDKFRLRYNENFIPT